jgi:hypothetical protein
MLFGTLCSEQATLQGRAQLTVRRIQADSPGDRHSSDCDILAQTRAVLAIGRLGLVD